MNKKLLFSVVAFIVITVVGILVWQFWPKSDTEPVVCTQEAKVCPDGSSVSRIGPNCEFAECPAQKCGTSCKCMEKCNERGPIYVMHNEEASCPIGLICCCHGI